jgi:Co/Zn/Cd efflux system component
MNIPHSLYSDHFYRIERISTYTIGALLVALAIAAVATSATSLATHDHPSTALPSILIAATSTGFTFFLYLAKRYLARALDSSALNGEALCALCCMQLSIVLLVGSSIYRLWKGGWWVDAATAIVIGMMFGWEGVKMIKWARNEDFDGGCCGGCHSDKATPECSTPEAEAEKRKEPEQKDSLCSSSTRCCDSCKKEEPVNGEQV